MGQWGNCVECIGHQPDGPDEEVKSMDQAIQLVDDQDLIIWPNGDCIPRVEVDPVWLENSSDCRVAPVNSPEWIALRSQHQ
jgi:hypothetical protein